MSVLHTLARPAQLALEVRKSRFLAQARAIDEPASVPALLAALADTLATHNCWAWRCGLHYRFSDDGEPGGTAGRPILQAIDSQAFDRVLVVVTRWYGGIKLGTGGLARAYGGCAAECLRLAERVPLIDRSVLLVRCDFSALAMLQSRLADHEAELLDTRFDGDGAELELRLPSANVAGFDRLVRDLTRGRGGITRRD